MAGAICIIRLKMGTTKTHHDFSMLLIVIWNDTRYIEAAVTVYAASHNSSRCDHSNACTNFALFDSHICSLQNYVPFFVIFFLFFVF